MTVMTVREFLSRFRLHDSGVNWIEYRPAAQLLHMAIELCNYDQPDFRDGDPERVVGKLEFLDVRDYAAEPAADAFAWSNKVDGEILRCELDTTGETDALKMVVQVVNYPEKKRDILVLRFRPASVRWTVLPGSKRP